MVDNKHIFFLYLIDLLFVFYCGDVGFKRVFVFYGIKMALKEFLSMLFYIRLLKKYFKLYVRDTINLQAMSHPKC